MFSLTFKMKIIHILYIIVEDALLVNCIKEIIHFQITKNQIINIKLIRYFYMSFCPLIILIRFFKMFNGNIKNVVLDQRFNGISFYGVLYCL